MTMIKKSITVTVQQDEWIQAQMATGNYGTDSEVIREALREKAMRTTEVELIRAKLIASERNGFTDLNRDQILEKSKEELRKDGKL